MKDVNICHGSKNKKDTTNQRRYVEAREIISV